MVQDDVGVGETPWQGPQNAPLSACMRWNIAHRCGSMMGVARDCSSIIWARVYLKVLIINKVWLFYLHMYKDSS